MNTPIAVIINARAGASHDAALAASLQQKFHRAGVDVRITLASDGKQMMAAARAAVAAGAAIVVAGGGDGTMNTIATELVGTSCAIGVLPLGTLNHFARDLQIPLELDQAIATISAGNWITIDTGEVNGRLFLNNSGIGMYPDIVRDREHQQRRLGRGKWLAFATATLTALRRYPFLTAKLIVDGHEHVRRTPFIFIGNNEYSISGFTLGERTSLRDGRLSLYVTQRTSRLGLLRLALHSLFGRLHQAHDFDALSAQELVIETSRHRLHVATDGEINRMQTPLQYRIRTHSLRVIVPATGPADYNSKTD